MIDPHIHIDSCSRNDLDLMAISGINKVVSPTYYPHRHLSLTSNTILDVYERAIKFETWRAKQHLIEVYVAISLNPVCIPRDYHRVLEAIPKYLSEERVIAIGEIGLEPASETCSDLGIQTEIVKEQLKIAKHFDRPVIFHTPHSDKVKWVDQYLKLITEQGIEPNKVIIDHVDSTVLRKISDFGCYSGITVQPWRGLSPLNAAEILKNSNLDFTFVNSDCNGTLPSDPLSVPKTALQMRIAGFSEDDIRRVTLKNPLKVYNISETPKNEPK